MAMMVTGNIMDNMAGYERMVTVGLDLMFGIALFLWAMAVSRYKTEITSLTLNS